jgi:putative metallohydrolase (TIGR04338 family)
MTGIKLIVGPSKPERDSQRLKLYRAERVLQPISRRFSSMEEVNHFATAVWTDDNVRAMFDGIEEERAQWHIHPGIKDGRGRKHAGGCYAYVTLPTWARTDHFILHELAHVLTQRICGLNAAGHGWQFCAIFHRLVQVIMGEHAAAVLKGAFVLHGVKMKPPKRRATRAAAGHQAPANP